MLPRQASLWACLWPGARPGAEGKTPAGQERVVPWGQGLTRGVCVGRGWEDSPLSFTGPLAPPNFFPWHFFFFFGQTVTFQTSDSKCSVSQNIMKLGLLPFTWGSPVSGGAEGSPGAGALILGEIYSVEAILHCPLSLLQPCSKSIQIGK